MRYTERKTERQAESRLVWAGKGCCEENRESLDSTASMHENGTET